MIEKTVAELSASLAAGDISSVELTQAYLARIAAIMMHSMPLLLCAKNLHWNRPRRQMKNARLATAHPCWEFRWPIKIFFVPMA